MPLTLTIENLTVLPDGGPLSTTVSGGRGLDIGRAAHLDWTLPDPDRVVSSKHCEVRRRDGAYWLTDVSTNGTYLNGSDRRMSGPHRLRNGDRLAIGPYIIAVSIQGEDADAPRPGAGTTPASATAPDNPWDDSGENVAPPVDRAGLMPQKPRQDMGGDFIDWVVDEAPVSRPQTAPSGGEKPTPSVQQPVPANIWGDEGGVAPPERAIAAHATASVGHAAGRLPPARIIGDFGSSAWSRGGQAQPDGRPMVAEVAAGDGAPQKPVEAPRVEPPRHDPLEDRRGAPALPGDADLVARFSRGAGLPPDLFADADPGQTMERARARLALVAGHHPDMLAARAEARRQMRAAGQTTVEALDNNPLKTLPDPAEALRIMLGQRNPAYLDAETAFAEAFVDLKVHQIALFEAMREAIANVMADFAPAAIEAEVERESRGIGFLANRKAQAWDLFATRWAAKSARHDNGIVDTFLLDLVRCYDRSTGRRF